jgi:hypothetical protein
MRIASVLRQDLTQLLTPSATQEDLDRVRREETDARETLHNRLERMVVEVEDVINSKEIPEPLTPDLEVDELYDNELLFRENIALMTS